MPKNGHITGLFPFLYPSGGQMQLHPKDGSTLPQDLAATPEYVPYSARLDVKTKSRSIPLQTVKLRIALKKDERFRMYADKRLGITVVCLGKMPNQAYLWLDDSKEETLPCILHMPTTVFAVIHAHPQAIFDTAVDLTPSTLLDQERRALGEKVESCDLADDAAHKRLEDRKLELRRLSHRNSLEADEATTVAELRTLEADAKRTHLAAFHIKQRWYLLENAAARKAMTPDDRRDEIERRRKLSDSMHPPRV